MPTIISLFIMISLYRMLNLSSIETRSHVSSMTDGEIKYPLTQMPSFSNSRSLTVKTLINKYFEERILLFLRTCRQLGSVMILRSKLIVSCSFYLYKENNFGSFSNKQYNARCSTVQKNYGNHNWWDGSEMS